MRSFTSTLTSRSRCCRPSRGPTSTISTADGNLIVMNYASSSGDYRRSRSSALCRLISLQSLGRFGSSRAGRPDWVQGTWITFEFRAHFAQGCIARLKRRPTQGAGRLGCRKSGLLLAAGE